MKIVCLNLPLCSAQIDAREDSSVLVTYCEKEKQS